MGPAAIEALRSGIREPSVGFFETHRSFFEPSSVRDRVYSLPIRTDRYKYVRRFDDYPYPVLPNCDESPSKNAYLERGWATRAVPRESLHDLAFNPGEGRNYIDNDGYSGVLAELRERLEEWMVGTDDPLLRGPVAPPVGAQINAQSQRSASDPTFVIEEADVAAPR